MGTWSLPQTRVQAEELLKLLAQPLKASEATEKLYHLIGDDDLFDVIGKADDESSGEADVRVFVKTSLANFLQHTALAYEPWEPEALALLIPACEHYLPGNFLESDGRT